MCTLVVFNELVEGYPLVIAANRDERYDRPSQPPHECLIKQTLVTCPRDEEKGGTWFGVTSTGWFVGLTNQDDGKHDPTLLSRGQVVIDLLAVRSHTQAASVLASIDPTRYNPFNVVFGRPGAMFLTRVLVGQRVEMEPLPMGINIVSNDCWGELYKARCDRARALASSVSLNASKPQALDFLFGILRDHNSSDEFQSLCVHSEAHAFGTRSSSLVAVSSQGVVEYWYSEGPPCQSKGLTLVTRTGP